LISDDLLQEIEGEIRSDQRVMIRGLHSIILEVSNSRSCDRKSRVQKIVRTLGAQNVNGRSQKETDGFRSEVSQALRTERR
jgi:hypothetical protein